jgi:general stress protein YciG
VSSSHLTRAVASRSSSAVRIGFKAARSGGRDDRTAHRHRVGLGSFKVALKEDYEAVWTRASGIVPNTSLDNRRLLLMDHPLSGRCTKSRTCTKSEASAQKVGSKGGEKVGTKPAAHDHNLPQKVTRVIRRGGGKNRAGNDTHRPSRAYHA